jgi:bacteriocin resistance YdeI/OmpD-like protein/uncharacterized protein DUF1905
MPVNFRARLGDLEKGNLALIKLPFDPKAEFGKARAPVVATVNGVTWRTTVSVYGGEAFIGVRAELRAQGKLEPGKMVDVTLALDDAPRTVETPPDLARALKAAKAKDAWEKLSFSHQNEHVKAIEEAKAPETRARRVAKAVEMVLAKKK